MKANRSIEIFLAVAAGCAMVSAAGSGGARRKSRRNSRSIHEEDRVMAKHRYANTVTKLRFGSRTYMQAGQTRGVKPDLARELIAGRHTTGLVPASTDATVAVEPKRKMKGRTRRRPACWKM